MRQPVGPIELRAKKNLKLLSPQPRKGLNPGAFKINTRNTHYGGYARIQSWVKAEGAAAQPSTRTKFALILTLIKIIQRALLLINLPPPPPPSYE